MAVTVASLTHGSDSDGNSTCTTASVAPSANKLQLLAVVSRTGITADPNIPTITGNGLTWVQVATIVYDNTSSSRRRLTLFRAMGASPSSGTIGIDFGGQNQTNVVWTLDEATGMDTGGTNGSAAIVQSATAFDNATGTPVSTLTVTLAAFGSADNGTFGVFANGVATDTATAGSGFSKVSEDNSGGTTQRLTSEYKGTNDTGVDMSWSNVSELGGIAVEIKNGAVDITVSPTVLAATFSLPAATLTTGSTASPSVLAATFSIPSITITTGSTISASVLSATFSLPASSVEFPVTVSPSVLAATFSIIDPTVTAELNVAAPTVTTQAATGIGQQSATLNGNVTVDGGGTITERGFQYNTVAYPDKQISTTGSFSTGAFTETPVGLTPGQIYYFRAFATNIGGTGYGDWLIFMPSADTYSILINGVERKTDVINTTPQIDDAINDKQNTCSFVLIDRSGNGIPNNEEVVTITLADGTILFSGKILTVKREKKGRGTVYAEIDAVDYARTLDQNLVHKSYEDMTDKEIIEDIVDTYCAGFGITTDNVIEGVTISQISFNYIQPSQCFRKICDLTGRNWFIDYEKDIHYFPQATDAAPFNITSSNVQYYDLKIISDTSMLRNRVYVRGGTKLSDPTFYETKGDGVARKFPLPDKPHDVTVKVNGTIKTLGIKNIDTSGFDYYLNFQEKYIEQDSGATLLATTDTLRVEYAYDIPILVAVENTASIAAYGVKEFPIFDKSITTTQAARDRASAELTDYATSLIEGSFKTMTPGFRSGQYLTINLTDYNVNAQYLIQRVEAHSIGAGVYEYTISIASAKTMGIIRFLIELLEANKNLIELDPDEVVDELFAVTDSLLQDSLTEVLTIDSAGPYRTWSFAGDTSPTRAKWNLFAWK